MALIVRILTGIAVRANTIHVRGCAGHAECVLSRATVRALARALVVLTGVRLDDVTRDMRAQLWVRCAVSRRGAPETAWVLGAVFVHGLARGAREALRSHGFAAEDLFRLRRGGDDTKRKK